MNTPRPIADGVFTWPADEPQLLGSRCDDCGTTTFPSQSGCPRCGREGMTEKALGRHGTVWTWTTQDFVQKEPYRGPEEPYVLAYVELPDGVRVESRLVDVDVAEVNIGMEVELAIVPFATAPDGTPLLAYAFRPAEAAK